MLVVPPVNCNKINNTNINTKKKNDKKDTYYKIGKYYKDIHVRC